jgi:hypothetical protein
MSSVDIEKRRAYQKARYQANKEKGAARIREWRDLNPGKDKAIRERGLAKQTPEDRARKVREWRQANPEKAKAIDERAKAKRIAASSEKPKLPKEAQTPEQKAAEQKKWRAENKERVRELRRNWKQANPEKVKASHKEYAKANPHKAREQKARREASKIRATPEWADTKKMQEVYAEAQFLRDVVGGDWHVDHIAPLRSKLVCGLHNHFNLQVLPGEENIAKSNKFWPDMP